VKGTIAVDFDGVVHSYDSGWTGPEPIDPPVPGARAAIAAIRGMGWTVAVFTCRALTADGMAGTKAWLAKHEIEVDEVTGVKPHAALYIDDRGLRFDGNWHGIVEDLLNGVPRPWNADRQPAVPVQLERFPPLCATCGVVVSQVTPAGTYTACGHPIPDAGRIS
jgi:hypothetical protein